MYVDIIVVIILLIYLIIGFSLGFFVEFISLFGLLGNFIIVSYLNPLLVDFIKEYYSDINYIVGYTILFVTFYLILILIIKYINMLFIGQDKNILNRIGGGLISLFKGAMVTAVIISIFIILSNQYTVLKTYGEGSKVIEYYLEVEENISDYLPSEFETKIDDIKEKEILEQYIKKIL